MKYCTSQQVSTILKSKLTFQHRPTCLVLLACTEDASMIKVARNCSGLLPRAQPKTGMHQRNKRTNWKSSLDIGRTSSTKKGAVTAQQCALKSSWFLADGRGDPWRQHVLQSSTHLALCDVIGSWFSSSQRCLCACVMPWEMCIAWGDCAVRKKQLIGVTVILCHRFLAVGKKTPLCWPLEAAAAGRAAIPLTGEPPAERESPWLSSQRCLRMLARDIEGTVLGKAEKGKKRGCLELCVSLRCFHSFILFFSERKLG